MSESDTSSSVIRGTTIVSLLTLLSRILGFVRDLLVARLFGATFIADAFFVAFRIPNLLRSFVAEGALTSAFVPVFSAELHKGKEHAQRVVSSVSGLLVITTTVISAIGVFYAPAIVAFFAPGFGTGTEKAALCISLTRIMLPYIIFVSVVAMLNGALNTLKVFGASANAQVVMNLLLILGALVAAPLGERDGVMMLAWSVLAGGLAGVAVQLPALKRAGLSIMPSLRVLTAPVRQLLALMLPATIGAAVYQIYIFIDTVFASLLESGSVSWLFYADRISQFPLGIFSIALAQVLLPALATARVRGDEQEFGATLINALRYTSFLTMPLAFGLYLFAYPLVVVLLERGAFSPYAGLKTALAVQALSLGLWSVSCHTMLVRAFIARRDTKTPTIVGALTIALNIVLSFLMMGPPRTPTPGPMYDEIIAVQAFLGRLLFTEDLGHVGLSLGSSFSSLAGMAILVVLLHYRSSADWAPFLRATTKTIIACAVMPAVLALLPTNELSPLGRLVVGVPLSGAAFLAAAWVLRIRECFETLTLFKRQFRRFRREKPV